jgi:uncharacterized protein (TIGR03083 family)
VPIDRFAAYDETSRSLQAFVRELGEPELATIVPACPAWSVKDVLAHVVAEAEIAATGSLPPDVDLVQALQDEEHAARREAMNAREVERRRDHTVDQLLAEWDRLMEDLGPMLRDERPFPYAFPFVDAVAVMDVALHNQDIRNAVGRPGDRETDAVRLGMSAYAFGADNKIRMLGLAPLRLRYDGREKVIGGDAEPAATLAAERYELYRALASRRSPEQIRAMDWDGDAEPYLAAIPMYGERDEPIIE